MNLLKKHSLKETKNICKISQNLQVVMAKRKLCENLENFSKGFCIPERPVFWFHSFFQLFIWKQNICLKTDLHFK